MIKSRSAKSVEGFSPGLKTCGCASLMRLSRDELIENEIPDLPPAQYPSRLRDLFTFRTTSIMSNRNGAGGVEGVHHPISGTDNPHENFSCKVRGLVGVFALWKTEFARCLT